MAKAGSEFERNVFINCPFDPEYRPLLRAMLFTVIYCDLNPRIATEGADSGEVRIKKIVDISGNDIEAHDDDPERLVRCLSDWFGVKSRLA